jgi:hypothetical protein
LVGFEPEGKCAENVFIIAVFTNSGKQQKAVAFQLQVQLP